MKDKAYFGLSSNFESLTPLEEKIVRSIGDKERRMLKQLYNPAIHKEKESIIGVRSEDILFFLECVRQGHMPSNGNLVRGKSKNYFYLTANPESTELRQRKVEVYGCKDDIQTFGEFTVSNNFQYGDIGIFQAMNRGLIPWIDKKKLFKSISEHGEELMISGQLNEDFYFDIIKILKLEGEHERRVGIKGEPMFRLLWEGTSSTNNTKRLRIFPSKSCRKRSSMSRI